MLGTMTRGQLAYAAAGTAQLTRGPWRKRVHDRAQKAAAGPVYIDAEAAITGMSTLE